MALSEHTNKKKIRPLEAYTPVQNKNLRRRVGFTDPYKSTVCFVDTYKILRLCLQNTLIFFL